jgi:hypothetical protein
MTDESYLSPDARDASENRWKPPPAFKPAQPTGDSPLPHRSQICFARTPRPGSAAVSAAGAGSVSPPSCPQNSFSERRLSFSSLPWNLGFAHWSFPRRGRDLAPGRAEKRNVPREKPVIPHRTVYFSKKYSSVSPVTRSPKWTRSSPAVGGYRHFLSLDSLLRFASLCVNWRLNSSPHTPLCIHETPVNAPKCGYLRLPARIKSNQPCIHQYGIPY